MVYKTLENYDDFTKSVTIAPLTCTNGTFKEDISAPGAHGYCTCNDGWACTDNSLNSTSTKCPKYGAGEGNCTIQRKYHCIREPGTVNQSDGNYNIQKYGSGKMQASMCPITNRVEDCLGIYDGEDGSPVWPLECPNGTCPEGATKTCVIPKGWVCSAADGSDPSLDDFPNAAKGDNWCGANNGTGNKCYNCGYLGMVWPVNSCGASGVSDVCWPT